MVRIKRSYRIQVCGTKIRPTWRAPLGFSTDRQIGTDQTPTHAKSPIAVHRRSACSGVKALRNTSAARRQAAKLCYRFGPLTPPARSANLIAGDGTKNGFPAPNKEPAPDQKRLLDRKSPIQVRIRFPPAASLLRKSSAGDPQHRPKRRPRIGPVPHQRPPGARGHPGSKSRSVC